MAKIGGKTEAAISEYRIILLWYNACKVNVNIPGPWSVRGWLVPTALVHSFNKQTSGFS